MLAPELSKLVELEKRIPFSDIIFFRQIAHNLSHQKQTLKQYHYQKRVLFFFALVAIISIRWSRAKLGVLPTLILIFLVGAFIWTNFKRISKYFIVKVRYPFASFISSHHIQSRPRVVVVLPEDVQETTEEPTIPNVVLSCQFDRIAIHFCNALTKQSFHSINFHQLQLLALFDDTSTTVTIFSPSIFLLIFFFPFS